MKKNSLFPEDYEPKDIPSSFDQLIQQELTKFDAVVPAVNELAKEFMPLKIQSLEDKDGYVEVSKALRFIVSKRRLVKEAGYKQAYSVTQGTLNINDPDYNFKIFRDYIR